MKRLPITAMAMLLLLALGSVVRADDPAPQAAPDTQVQQVTLHPEHLNPAFVLSGPTVSSLADQGKKAFADRKTRVDILKPYLKHPVGIIGEKGVSRQSEVLFNADGGNGIILNAYNAATNYKPVDLPDNICSGGTYYKTVKFFIHLVSTPKMRGRRVRADASEDDVKINNVVVTDDAGDTLFPLSSENVASHSGEERISGVNVVPHTITQNSTANAIGPGGSVSAWGNSTTTYNTYMPWSEDHPYFEATYIVEFPLFDDKGEPIVKENAKKLTLHIIRPVGEQQVEYTLTPVALADRQH